MSNLSQRLCSVCAPPQAKGLLSVGVARGRKTLPPWNNTPNHSRLLVKSSYCQLKVVFPRKYRDAIVHPVNKFQRLASADEVVHLCGREVTFATLLPAIKDNLHILFIGRLNSEHHDVHDEAHRHCNERQKQKSFHLPESPGQLRLSNQSRHRMRIRTPIATLRTAEKNPSECAGVIACEPHKYR